jgi:hypothetical protein
MIRQLRRILAPLLFLLTATVAHAAFVPLSVYPNPAQFGTVAEYSSGYLTLYVTNVTANSVTITSVSISGSNSADFAFANNNCVGTLGADQNCEMTMVFTPSAIGALSANLLISVQGLTQPIMISLDGTGGTPVPTLTSMSPTGVYLNSAGFTLTVNGTGFVSGASVYWNYGALTTTYVSSTQLTALVPASDLTYANSYSINVANPGGSFSSSLNFNVIGLDPSINNLAPTSMVAKTAPAAVVINGYNFMTGAKVLWNGKPMTTTYLSPSQLQVTPTAAQVASASIVQLTVSNPPPGGVSAEVNFNVTYPAKVTVLDLPANDLVWDPYAQRIYASLPSSYGTQGNTIAVINPTTGRVTGYYFAGSEPNQLAISADSQYLYVGLNGNGSVQRLILPAFSPDIDVSLGISQYGGLNTALALQVSPSDPHTFAVPEGTSGCCGSSGLYFFKDSTQLADNITYPSFTDIVFVNASTLYAYYNGTLGQVAVNSSGGTLTQQWNSLVEGNTIQYDSGLIYGSNGQVLNPTTGLLIGTYDVLGSSCCSSSNQLMPDSAIDRVFDVGISPFFSSFGITAYDLAKFTPVAVTNLSQLTATTPLSFIRWGNNGLAFVLQSGCCGSPTTQVILVQSPAMFAPTGAANNPLPVAQSLSPANATHGTWNFVLNLQGKNFIPGSQVTWNGASLTADYISPTQLNVYVPAANIASSGTAKIVVNNPAPGGGPSSSLAFSIN